MAELNEKGHEILDETPVSVPFKIQRRSYFDHVREFIRQEVSRNALETGHETFEEADDFDVGDDYDPSSPYEMQFDPDLGPQSNPFNDEKPTPEATAEGGDKPDSGASGEAS